MDKQIVLYLEDIYNFSCLPINVPVVVGQENFVVVCEFFLETLFRVMYSMGKFLNAVRAAVILNTKSKVRFLCIPSGIILIEVVLLCQGIPCIEPAILIVCICYCELVGKVIPDLLVREICSWIKKIR